MLPTSVGSIIKDKKMREFKKHKTDNGAVVEVAQDVSDIVEQNKKEFNSASTTWGSGDVFDNKIASIPLTVIDKLNQQGIMRGFHVLDMPKFKHWLNDPDNRFFRTKPGKV